MKPTRKIVRPNVGLWKPKGSVWFKKNDDGTIGRTQMMTVRRLQRNLRELPRNQVLSQEEYPLVEEELKGRLAQAKEDLKNWKETE